MKEDENLDIPRLKWFLDHLMKNGVHGVFVLGTNRGQMPAHRPIVEMKNCVKKSFPFPRGWRIISPME